MASADQPLMHEAQFQALWDAIKTEIEFALDVDHGGRYNRENLRKRMRATHDHAKQLLTKEPMGVFGMGENAPEIEPSVPDEYNEGEDDDDEEEEPELVRIPSPFLRAGTDTKRASS